MIRVFARHKVRDYDEWKKAFDSVLDVRQAGGEKSFKLGHIHGESNNLLITFEWDSVENAKKFLESKELADEMIKAGVLEKPDFFYVDDF